MKPRNIPITSHVAARKLLKWEERWVGVWTLPFGFVLLRDRGVADPIACRVCGEPVERKAHTAEDTQPNFHTQCLFTPRTSQ